jgi:excinuclease ABC subunit A
MLKGGRCETCQGSGVRTIEMNFYLMFMWNAKHVKASVLIGNSFGLKESLSDVLNMTVDEAVPFLK